MEQLLLKIEGILLNYQNVNASNASSNASSTNSIVITDTITAIVNAITASNATATNASNTNDINDKYNNILSNHTFFNIKRVFTCLANNVNEGFTNKVDYTSSLIYVIIIILLIRILF